MDKQLVIFTKEELLKLLDGGPVRMEGLGGSSRDYILQRRWMNGWLTFCDWIEELPYSELITGKEYEVEE